MYTYTVTGNDNYKHKSYPIKLEYNNDLIYNSVTQ